MTTPGQSDRVEGYEPYFGLHEAPFSLAPDPRFLFGSASHSAALAQVAYALERREPLIVITGEIGTGKTLLCRTVLQRLRQKTFLSVVTDPLLERDDLLKQLLQDFGIISKDRTKLTDTSRHALVETLQAFLSSLVPLRAHAVVIIDEAQHLQPDVLEQIRLLSNIDDERGTLLQIMLVGQTDLEVLLSRPELHQLQQRVSRRLRLEPLTGDEVEQYVTHRLALARDVKPSNHLPGANELARELAEWAGANAGVDFTPDAIHAVSHLSGGLPRVINLLCDRALEEAYASRLRVIDRPLIQTAATALAVVEPAAWAAPADIAAEVSSADRLEAQPDESFWPATPFDSDVVDTSVDPADEPVPGGLSVGHRPAAAPRFTMYMVLAACLAFAAVSIWLVVRAARPPEAHGPPSAAPPTAPATLVFSDRPESAQAGGTAPAPEAAPTTGTPAPPSGAAGAPAAQVDESPLERREVTQLRDPRFKPSTDIAAPAGERFDIVVASFRTDARAASVAAEVASLGLPIRRRVSDGWQQVLSGPFSSRADAGNAQERLQRAGLTGTQIVPAVR